MNSPVRIELEQASPPPHICNRALRECGVEGVRVTQSPWGCLKFESALSNEELLSELVRVALAYDRVLRYATERG